MIGAFARAAQVLGDESYLRAAQHAAAFARKNLFDPDKNELLRSYREGPSKIRGFAADYAFLISGLLDLYEADFDLEWLRWARQLQDTLDLHFWDQERGGYFSTSVPPATPCARFPRASRPSPLPCRCSWSAPRS